MSLKKKLLTSIFSELENKLKIIQKDIEDLRTELSDNTKSTAGDKHETSRAMTHLEMEKLGKQFLETQKLLNTAYQFENIEPKTIVDVGSLVQCNNAIFLMGLPLGKVIVEEQIVYSISLSSPVGQVLLGKEIGAEVKLPAGISKIQSID